MPVKKDPSGRRSVEAACEVPGTPEQVWQAIATGPGVSSWFVPTEIEERTGGRIVSRFGPGMDAVATVTAWEPPHRFVAESADELGPNDQPVATEWIVEARAGGTCTVRVVHRWFASSDEWDDQFEGHTHGWQSFFRVLRLYLAHFPGQAGSSFQVMGMAPEPKEDAWAALTQALGLVDAEVGRSVRTTPDAPPLAGVVEWAGQPAWPEELLVRLADPAPGIAHLVPHPMGGAVYLSVRCYLYGAGANAAVDRAEPLWREWLATRFPLAGEEVAAD